jgi:hypothetical protein
MADTATIDDREFGQFQSWLYRAAGINLSPAKKALVAGRLFKRLKHYELQSYGEYFKLIMKDERNLFLSRAQALRFPASAGAAQGRAGQGVSGMECGQFLG